MNLDSSTFRNDKIELVRSGEIANTGMCSVRWLVSRNHIVPYTHLVNFFSSRYRNPELRVRTLRPFLFLSLNIYV